MFKKMLHRNFLNKQIVILFFLYLSLIISFVLGENSTGGAIIDYINQKKISEYFSLNFSDTLNQYDNFTTRHSPILIMILGVFEKLNFSDSFIRFLHLNYCLLLPFFFYKCLEVKFKNINAHVFFLLIFLIFLSPTFRSLAIWPDSRISGLIFFTFGLFYYLKFINEKKFNYVILNTFLIACSAYFSPNFSIFAIYFIFNFISHYGLNSKKTFLILLLNSILALPAFYYIFYLEINFLTNSAAVGINDSEQNFFNNIFNDILISFTLIFFYIVPFLITKIIGIENPFDNKNIFLSVLIFLICVVNFDYNFLYTGGGVFLQFSNFIFGNNYFFYLIGFISIFICLPYIIKSKFNIFIFLLILLNNPQYTIYHKYFDPFLLILFFTLFDLNLQISKVMLKKNYIIVFFYFLSFLIISNLKYLWKI